MLSRSRLPSVVHVVRSGEVLSQYDVEVLREIIRRVALRMLNEQAESGQIEKRYFLAPRTGRYTNQLVIIPIPYNPLLFPDKKSGPKIKKRRNILLTTNWYQKALKYQRMLHRSVVMSKAELAKKEGISRAKVTQILNLMNLAPEIRNYLTTIAARKDLKILTERRLREIAKINNPQLQMRRFRELLKLVDKS